ncbi:MAG TPA: rhomboid family intramembrane serine protease [Symbiobacteriaceae bacterium]
MVLPVRDSAQRRRYPWLTLALIMMNVAIFGLEVVAGPAAWRLLGVLAVVPTQVLDPAAWTAGPGWLLLSLVASTFLHGSWAHLLGNMLYLWIFGDNVEDVLGPWRYLIFYLLCGVLANVAHVLANPASAVPTIGASGAVAGVLGAYILFFPRAKVLTLVPVGPVVPAIRVPAWAYLSLWFLFQLVSGLAPIWVRDLTQTVAFWAHISGFLTGIALARLLLPAQRNPVAGR